MMRIFCLEQTHFYLDCQVLSSEILLSCIPTILSVCLCKLCLESAENSVPKSEVDLNLQVLHQLVALLLVAINDAIVQTVYG